MQKLLERKVHHFIILKITYDVVVLQGRKESAMMD